MKKTFYFCTKSILNLKYIAKSCEYSKIPWIAWAYFPATICTEKLWEWHFMVPAEDGPDSCCYRGPESTSCVFLHGFSTVIDYFAPLDDFCSELWNGTCLLPWCAGQNCHQILQHFTNLCFDVFRRHPSLLQVLCSIRRSVCQLQHQQLPAMEVKLPIMFSIFANS